MIGRSVGKADVDEMIVEARHALLALLNHAEEMARECLGPRHPNQSHRNRHPGWGGYSLM